ncbi:hypothetical protein SDC9_168411 [bioreactor metagenome]|uniref:Uncharacterized protein n=1 Tax=bioreactor metagenome TaxID=1076179 RepID=A0A645G4Z2_9ZZZZ
MFYPQTKSGPFIRISMNGAIKKQEVSLFVGEGLYGHWYLKNVADFVLSVFLLWLFLKMALFFLAAA